MKAILEIINVLLSLFAGKRQKALKSNNEFYQEIETRPSAAEPPPKAEPLPPPPKPKKIVCNNVEVDIDWQKVTLWTEPGALICKSDQYKRVPGNRAQTIDKIVVHWDGCLSSEQCAKVLDQRGLSAHFCINSDGTVHQLMDTNDIGWHARGVNTKSIGIEISNAVYMKYAKKYDPPRPVVPATKLHGKTFPQHLGFYDVQVEALKQLIKSLTKFYNVPLEFPNADGELIKGVIKASSFKGVICHYHVTENKTDPACLDLAKVIEEIKNEQE